MLFLEKKNKREQAHKQKNPASNQKEPGISEPQDFISMSMLSASYVVYKVCLKQRSQSIGLI